MYSLDKFSQTFTYQKIKRRFVLGRKLQDYNETTLEIKICIMSPRYYTLNDTPFSLLKIKGCLFSLLERYEDSITPRARPYTWVYLFFPLRCDSLSSVTGVWAVLPMCCWVCHILHMPCIHRTLPNIEVCEPERRWAFHLYLHHDNIMGGLTVTLSADVVL